MKWLTCRAINAEVWLKRAAYGLIITPKSALAVDAGPSVNRQFSAAGAAENGICSLAKSARRIFARLLAAASTSRYYDLATSATCENKPDHGAIT